MFNPTLVHKLARTNLVIPTTRVTMTRNVSTVLEISLPHRFCQTPSLPTLKPVSWPIECKIVKSSQPLPSPLIASEEKIAQIHAPRDRPLPAYLPEATRFSSWQRLLRTTARVLQAKQLFKALANPSTKQAALITREFDDKTPRVVSEQRPTATLIKMAYTPIEPTLIKKAEHLHIREIQRKSFSTQIDQLKSGEPIERDSRLSKLCVQIDERDILHTYERPVIDANHHITQLIIHHTHCELNHGNHETVMKELRQKYYVLALRHIVPKMVHTCKWC
ncbi:hypothetical protein O0L34_g19526 [Tuta absoluta]|nr:hypothetical protein O0L34_g19526 [Tuta absoluta]